MSRVRDSVFLILYQVILLAILPVFICYLVVRKFRGKSVVGSWCERLGFVPKAPSDVHVTWIHAVSVGEVLSVQRIIQTIKQKSPQHFVYLTVGTLQGKQIAQQQVEADQISFIPYDFFFCVWLAWRRIKPQRLFLVEAEWWPSMLMCAKIWHVDTYLLNARVSDRSWYWWRKSSWFMSWLAESFTCLFTLTTQDAKRFESLGVPSRKLEVMGNLKAYNVVQKQCDIMVQAANHALMNEYDKNYVLLVGSMHPGECDVYLRVFQQLKQVYPSCKLVLVPRHFHWQQELVAKVRAINRKTFVWDQTVSDITGFAALTSYDYDIVLVCVLGKLFSLYQYATVYCLGGTFVPIGGHNLLEPAVWGCPTIVGLYHHNVMHEFNQFEPSKAVLVASNEHELLSAVQHFFNDQYLRIRAGQGMQEWVQREALRVQQTVQRLI